MNSIHALHLNVADQRPVIGGQVDYRWTADYAAYRAYPLRWWDDASYAAYQADDGPSEWESFLYAWREALDVEAVRRYLACEPQMPAWVPSPAPMWHGPEEEDSIPF